MTEPSTRRWWMLAGVWFCYMTFGLSMASLAPLVREIESDLAFSHSAMGTVLGAWQFVYIFAAIPCGILLDRIGARWGLAIGALIIGLSGIFRGFAEEYIHLLIAVALFGLGGPLISAGAPKVVSERFEGKDRGLAMGIYITGPGIGAVTALLLTQPLILPWLDGNWRVLLQIWGGVSLAAGLFWLLVAKESPRTPDGVEGRAIMSGLVEMLRIPAVRLILLMSVAVFSINHGMGNWLVEILQSFGADVSRASALATIPVAVGILSALTLPRMAVGSRRFSVLILLFSCSVLASLALLGEPVGIWLYLALIVEGIAAGSMMTVLVLTLVEVPGVGDKRAGTAGGLFFSAAEIGGVGGPVLLGILFHAQGRFSSSLMVLALLGVLLVASVFPLRRHLLSKA
ncbi:MAG: MFS transporter [Proteobacteria bacterium]|nr:MFS transporter [Pseudomonadota bacterium]MBT6348779.1 MFS transporter [Pseudomonadota bacterium]